MSNAREIGRRFEQYAATQMRKAGYHILDTNWETVFHGVRYELDIIAKKGDTVVFTEVKARNENALFDPALSVTRHKQHSLRLAAKAYLAYLRKNNIDTKRYQYRFDVVAIRFDPAYHVTEYTYTESYMKVPDDDLFGFTL